MLLQNLLSGVKIRSLGGILGTNPEIRSLQCHSAKVERGSLFFAISGEKTDGHIYIQDALERGAVAVIAERKPPSNINYPWIQVQLIRSVMSVMADRFYNSPSNQLKLIAVTGTNGKTTASFLIHSILTQRSPSVLLGTIRFQIGNRELPTILTTPESIEMQRRLSESLTKGCKMGVAEVSSHALHQYRVFQCQFPVGIFTNLSRDHLDFHSSLESYYKTKCLLFNPEYNPGIKHAVLNADDHFAAKVPLQKSIKKVTFGFSKRCTVHPLSHQISIEGMDIKLKFFDGTLQLRSALLGKHNLYNIMCAAAATSLLGLTNKEIQNGVASLTHVPGRFETIPIGQPFKVIVDYAHTPDALENVLKLCRQLTKGRIFCVFGCGGNRDRGKRPMMGKVAASHSDYIILTSDNPRWEDPRKITQSIRTGMLSIEGSYEVLLDRQEAIARALKLATSGDIVLVAGKGHETYQEIEGKQLHFNDREVIMEVQ